MRSISTQISHSAYFFLRSWAALLFALLVIRVDGPCVCCRMCKLIRARLSGSLSYPASKDEEKSLVLPLDLHSLGALLRSTHGQVPVVP